MISLENSIPVSEIKDFNQTLHDVSKGSQVIITSHGDDKYAIVDADEWKKSQSTIKLLEELQKGYKSYSEGRSHNLDEFSKLITVDHE